MIQIQIPGRDALTLKHLVLDYNGTLAFDGNLFKQLNEELNLLAGKLKIHIITADTFGSVAESVKNINCTVHIITKEKQSKQKEDYISKLGASNVCAIGNGNNDALMLKKANLGIALIQNEGAATKTILNADIVCHSIFDALGLLHNPQRLIATLRD